MRTSTERTPKEAATQEIKNREAYEPIDSAALFAGRREVVILHNRERYVLRITRQGKLILNK